MKHKILSIICCAFMGVGTSGPVLGVEFVHPGVSHNQVELAFVKSKLKAQEQPWQEAWDRMLSSKEADLSWQTRAVAHVERGAYNRPDIGGSFFMGGGKAAYTHALLWVFTDKEAHAQKAAEILNAWSATLESVTNHDAKLLVGMGGLQFCNAAELLKHTWKGWPAKDQQAFGRMLQKVLYPVIQDFFPAANGNWDASMIQTMMAMGIFLDDHAIFQKAVDYYLNGVGNGAVNHYFKASGQCQESGRDQGHTQMGLEYLVNSAEIAWKQGVDLYSAYDNRLAAGFEYTAKYNLGNDVPFETYESYQGKYKHSKISDKSRGRLRPMYEKAYNHYHNRMSMDMPWCQKASQKTRPETGGTMPWSTLMYADQPAGLVKLAARGKEPPEDTAFVDRILPAPIGGGYEDPDYWVWGSSVIKGEDGKYHMFASRWLKKLGFGKWVTNSEVVHAVADTPVGPYKTVEVALPVRGKEHWDGLCTHNPKVIKYKNTYLLYYFGNTYDFRQPTVENTDLDSDDRTRAWMNKRVGVTISESVYGPWKRLDKPVIEPREGHWDASITSNPAPVVNENTGEILLMYKSSTYGKRPPLLLGVAKATNPEGPYERLSEDPIFRFETAENERIDVEDPYIWWNGEKYEAIIKDRSGEICGEEGGGIHAWSDDGVNWQLFDKVKAYSREVLWDDGTRTHQNHFERPFLLIEKGVPTHLFAATGVGPRAWSFDKTWNMVIPLKTDLKR